MGEGKNPNIDHLIKLGLDANLSKVLIDKIIEKTRSALAKWEELAKIHGVNEVNIKLIQNIKKMYQC